MKKSRENVALKGWQNKQTVWLLVDKETNETCYCLLTRQIARWCKKEGEKIVKGVVYYGDKAA